MAAPIQSPAKHEVHFVIRFLNTKVERPAEIYNPPYSPDLAPNDFHLFLHLKKHLAGKKIRRRWRGARRSHDVVQRAGGRLLWLGNTEAGSKT